MLTRVEINTVCPQWLVQRSRVASRCVAPTQIEQVELELVAQNVTRCCFRDSVNKLNDARGNAVISRDRPCNESIGRRASAAMQLHYINELTHAVDVLRCVPHELVRPAGNCPRAARVATYNAPLALQLSSGLQHRVTPLEAARCTRVKVGAVRPDASAFLQGHPHSTPSSGHSLLE